MLAMTADLIARAEALLVHIDSGSPVEEPVAENLRVALRVSASIIRSLLASRSEGAEGDTEIALLESVRLQSHYAGLLNQYDGGNRRTFPSAMEWIKRLQETGAFDRARASYAAPPASRSEGWQDISTAPKDGTLILMRFVGNRPYITGVVWRPEYRCFVQASDYSPVGFDTATGWMSPPPATKEQQ